ncbi:MAG: Xaa-Pro peptidase family protein [Pseudomonadota bacterium]
MTVSLPLPRSTYDARWVSLRAFLREEELECAIIVAPEPQYWLCGYDTFLGSVLPQALIFPASSEAPILVVWDADVAIARQTGLVEEIWTYRFGVDEPADRFIEAAARSAPGLKRVGVDLSSHALPYAFGAQLVEKLAGIEIFDIAPDLALMRAVKSPEELALMRAAGRYANAGLEAFRAHAKPGVSEIALAGEVEFAMRKAGSDYASIPTEMTSGVRSVQGHGTPAAHPLEPGALVHIEIGGVERRYNSVGMQTLVVPGAAPKASAVELYDLARDCLSAGLGQLRPGVPAAEVEAPALELIRSAGQGDNFKMRFGYGVGIGYPPTWLEPLKITRTSTDVLVPGTTFVLHACLLDEADNVGVLAGGTYAMTETGYEMLSGAGDVALRH